MNKVEDHTPQGRQLGFLTSDYVTQYFQFVTGVFYRQLCSCTHYCTWIAYRYIGVLVLLIYK